MIFQLAQMMVIFGVIGIILHGGVDWVAALRSFPGTSKALKETYEVPPTDEYIEVLVERIENGHIWH